MAIPTFKHFFCSQAICFVVFHTLFDLYGHVLLVYRCQTLPTMLNKRNKHLQKFNGGYQALTEVNLLR